MSLLRNFRNPWEVGGGEVVGSNVLVNRATVGNVLDISATYSNRANNEPISRINGTKNIIVAFERDSKTHKASEHAIFSLVNSKSDSNWDYFIVENLEAAYMQIGKYYEKYGFLENLVILEHGFGGDDGGLQFGYCTTCKGFNAITMKRYIELKSKNDELLLELGIIDNYGFRSLYYLEQIFLYLRENGNMFHIGCQCGTSTIFRKFYKQLFGKTTNLYLNLDSSPLGGYGPFKNLYGSSKVTKRTILDVPLTSMKKDYYNDKPAIVSKYKYGWTKSDMGLENDWIQLNGSIVLNSYSNIPFEITNKMLIIRADIIDSVNQRNFIHDAKETTIFNFE